MQVIHNLAILKLGEKKLSRQQRSRLFHSIVRRVVPRDMKTAFAGGHTGNRQDQYPEGAEKVSKETPATYWVFSTRIYEAIDDLKMLYLCRYCDHQRSQDA